MFHPSRMTFSRCCSPSSMAQVAWARRSSVRSVPAQRFGGVVLQRALSSGGGDEEWTEKPKRMPRFSPLRPSRMRRKQIKEDLQSRREALDSGAAKCGLPVGIKVSAVIERTPALMPDPEPYRDEMFRLQEKLREFDTFDFPKEVYGPAPKASEVDLPFDLAPRTTQADLENDRRSLHRSLTKSVYLLLKTTHDSSWQMPSAILKRDEEKLYNTCVRAIEESVGKELYTFVTSNGPVGVWFETLPESQRTEYYGFYNYFVKVMLVDLYNTGPVILDDKIATDYVWVSDEEFKEYIADEDYATFLGTQMLANVVIQ